MNVSTPSTNLPPVNNNSTILSLLASTSTQSNSAQSPAVTNINLSNLLSSTQTMKSISPNHMVNVSGQRVVAKRLKMQNTTRVITGNQQQVASSIGNATVIATAANSVPNVTTNISAQPVIRLSLSALTNQVRIFIVIFQ